MGSCDFTVLHPKVTVIGIVILGSCLNITCYNIISCPVLRVAFILKLCQEHHHLGVKSLIKHSPKECLSKDTFHLVSIYKTQSSICFEMTINHL